MKELLEIIRQINELSGVAMDALEQVAGGEGGGEGGGPKPPEGGAPPSGGGAPVPPGQ
jgi:hypothetical protein